MILLTIFAIVSGSLGITLIILRAFRLNTGALTRNKSSVVTTISEKKELNPATYVIGSWKEPRQKPRKKVSDTHLEKLIIGAMRDYARHYNSGRHFRGEVGRDVFSPKLAAKQLLSELKETKRLV